jgi:hypothetical protein
MGPDGRRAPGEIRGLRIALWRERRQTEKLLNRLLVAIKTEIGRLEGRMLAELENIDASIGLVAGELARHADDPPMKDVNHGH